ncbi:DoxX family protein [Acidicapsa dinghuensis]|uniref:DoxX family protein n=1 Tax=Acidicapsa dinghuensis TaxID=2218256 RepID=A0ABW1ELC7_9BACT|nr:DoxX family protein [Acidicapsa dinghuensis]
MSLFRRLCGLHDLVAGALNRLQSPLLLAIRLYWGYQLVQTGWGKLHNLDHVTDFFTSLNLPQPHFTAIFVSLVEFVGGILFALGFGARMVSLVLFINLTVAYWTADREAFGHIFDDPGKFYAADPYTFWFAALIILIFGPGYLAVETLLRRFTQTQNR